MLKYGHFNKFACNKHHDRDNDNIISQLVHLPGWEVYTDPIDNRLWYWCPGKLQSSFAHPLTPWKHPPIWETILGFLTTPSDMFDLQEEHSQLLPDSIHHST